ncbi:hypothetical protein MNEG_5816 [Monoraphidium neglectum]|uniref:Uncharacterized protein n=1 Tax=Monoraphidium neglectum TaxID=145388 RepID=A0A0D2L504_9CHLO|nr:hypothetical protein MNEG_5816 [Monoraphidium neglectum]KIZ02139.1 hypothetical protein MNEG_5816 [Monoraphidium neglectum]|eukprot:XP_013901158.1 hypothetical protein MNEG_5816 [Monoraphidium neglectum]
MARISAVVAFVICGTFILAQLVHVKAVEPLGSAGTAPNAARTTTPNDFCPRRSCRSRERGDLGFDYYLLARQWLGTVCAHEDCVNPPETSDFQFTLHGLWPECLSQDVAPDYPQCCDSSAAFSYSKISDLAPQLKTEWPSYKSTNGSGFWQHEWAKHGTCAMANGGVADEHDYFARALELHERFNIEDALSQEGITPDATRAYPGRQLYDALRRHLGHEALFFCDAQGNLGHVETCLDLQLRPMDCPDAPDFALARRRAAGAGSVGESYLNACRRDVKIPPLGQARSAASRRNIAPPPGPAHPAARGAAAAARGVGVKAGEWAAGCWQGLAVAAAAAVLMACLAALGRCPDEHKGGGHQRPLLA